MLIILSVLIVLVSIIIIMGLYLSVFASIDVKEKKIGPLKLIYKEYIGPYKETGQIQDEVYYSLLNEEKIETYKGFGIYYDDPKTTPDSELRSKSGCILEEKDYDKLDRLEEDYDLMELGDQKYIYAEFPFKSKLSIMLGVFKVYPQLDRYLEEKGYEKKEVMEIYDIPNKKIIYLMPTA